MVVNSRDQCKIIGVCTISTHLPIAGIELFSSQNLKYYFLFLTFGKALDHFNPYASFLPLKFVNFYGAKLLFSVKIFQLKIIHGNECLIRVS